MIKESDNTPAWAPEDGIPGPSGGPSPDVRLPYESPSGPLWRKKTARLASNDVSTSTC